MGRLTQDGHKTFSGYVSWRRSINAAEEETMGVESGRRMSNFVVTNVDHQWLGVDICPSSPGSSGRSGDSDKVTRIDSPEVEHRISFGTEVVVYNTRTHQAESRTVV